MSSILSIVVAFFLVLFPKVFTKVPLILFGGNSERFFPPKAVVLPVRKGDRVEHISLSELVETRCRALRKPFKPVWWLGNGHLQTMYCVMGDFSKKDQMWYRRTYLTTIDEGTLGIDFAPVDHEKLPADAPIVVVQHGLTGGSYEPYVRAILAKACAPIDEGGLGYRAVVINFRGCAGVPLTSPQMHSACCTDDTRDALRYVSHLYPKAPLIGLGFSLGAGVIVRYLGEEKENSRLSSGCALCSPWNLLKNNEGLMSSWFNKNIYAKAMGGNLLQLIRLHWPSISKFPQSSFKDACQDGLKLKSPTLSEFDQTVTRICGTGGGPGPHFPFASVFDYYVYGSSDKSLSDVTVPLLSISSGDDPVVKFSPREAGGNQNVLLQVTPGGGHLGWFISGQDGGVDRWTTEPVMQWLKLVGRDLVHDSKPKGSEIYVEDGFLKERAHPSLGCKFKEDGGIIDGNHGEAGTVRGL